MVTAAKKLFTSSPRKFIAAITSVALFAIHVFILSRGGKPPLGVDQALIASLGVLFAPNMEDVNKKGVAQ